MAQSALRCSEADLSTLARGSPAALGFGCPGPAVLAAAEAVVAAAAATVADVVFVVLVAVAVVFASGVGGTGGGLGDVSRRAAVEVRNGCRDLQAAEGRCGSHGDRVWAAVKLHRGHWSAERCRIRVIMAAERTLSTLSRLASRSSRMEGLELTPAELVTGCSCTGTAAGGGPIVGFERRETLNRTREVGRRETRWNWTGRAAQYVASQSSALLSAAEP